MKVEEMAAELGQDPVRQRDELSPGTSEEASGAASGEVLSGAADEALTAESRDGAGGPSGQGGSRDEHEAGDFDDLDWWERPRGRPVQAFFRTVVACLRHPFRFFGALDWERDRWPAMGFALVAHVLGFSAAAAWLLFFRPEEFTLAAIRVMLAPLWVLASVWAGSEMMHGFLGWIGGANAPRTATHRAVAYCYATALLGVVPLIGLRVGLGAALVYQIIALRQVHRVPTWKAAAAVLLTWLLLVGGLLVLAVGSEPPG